MRYFILYLMLISGFNSSFVYAEEETCQIYFSPEDKIAERLIDLIENEETSIHAAIYCLTHRGIADALTKAKKRGVDLEIIVDPFSIKARAPIQRLNQAGIPVFVWDPPAKEEEGKKSRKALMHDKFCVFGKEVVWTGSFNFTYEAERHKENVVLIKDKQVAGRYLEQFQTIKNEGCRRYSDYKQDHPNGKRKKK